jgi:hypothetical protein
MLQLDIPSSVFKAKPPPLWLVSNGELTVGPVLTDLLVRGVKYGKIPNYCYVRELRGGWRTLDSIRELAALGRQSEPTPRAQRFDSLATIGQLFDRIRDTDELLQYVTQLSILVTGATAGMFHYAAGFGQPRTLTTRCVLGPLSTERLGQPLAGYDQVLRMAKIGRPVLGQPGVAPAERAIAARFANMDGGVRGVAMIPFWVAGGLTGILELSRSDRPFRRDDLQRAERFVQRALRRRQN